MKEITFFCISATEKCPEMGKSVVNTKISVGCIRHQETGVSDLKGSNRLLIRSLQLNTSGADSDGFIGGGQGVECGESNSRKGFSIQANLQQKNFFT